MQADAAAAAASDSLDADAFRKVFPEQYYARFLAQSVRPDGRRLGGARAASVALGVVSSADASALARVGATAALAAVRADAGPAGFDAATGGGRLEVAAALAPVCCAAAGAGGAAARAADAAAARLTAQLAALLGAPETVDPRQLCVDAGAGVAWALRLDVVVLDAAGSLLDCCLLAALAALEALCLPQLVVAPGGSGGSGGGALRPAAGAPPPRRLALGRRPTALTVALKGGRLLADPTAEEEALADAVVAAAVDERGAALALSKPGGRAGATPAQLRLCLEAAAARGGELRRVLDAALAGAAAGGAP